MPNYVYETIPATPDAPVKRYEIRHSISSPALTRHPETGEPIRRVVVSGVGILSSSAKASGTSSSPRSSESPCCGGGCACAR